MDYTKIANLWASYDNAKLCAFFKSDFLKKYLESLNLENLSSDQIPYEFRFKLSKDMEKLGLIPFTALEDAYSEERELEELQKFEKLYKF